MKGERLQIVVPPKVAKAVKAEAKRLGISVSRCVANRLIAIYTKGSR